MARTREEFIKLISEVMAIAGYVQKDAQNVHQGYKYASAEKVLGKVREALCERGLAVESNAELRHFEVFDTTKGKRSMAVVHIALTITDGENAVTLSGLGQGVDAGDKAIMKGNTAALKYACASGFLISWGDDPEGDPSGEEIGSRQQEVSLTGPQEDPTSDAEATVDLSQFPAWKTLITSMHGKKGVRELREAVMFAGLLGYDEERLGIRVVELEVDLAGMNHVQAIKLRDALKHERAAQQKDSPGA